MTALIIFIFLVSFISSFFIIRRSDLISNYRVEENLVRTDEIVVLYFMRIMITILLTLFSIMIMTSILYKPHIFLPIYIMMFALFLITRKDGFINSVLKFENFISSIKFTINHKEK